MQLSEAFLHYLWKYQLFDTDKLICSDGQPVEIIQTGLHNRDAGPDFLNTKLKIGSQLWAGNVEIHIKASDWQRHGHHTDAAYNNVILHVVAEADAPTLLENGREAPTAVLKYPKQLFEKYRHYIESHKKPLCADDLHKINRFNLKNWLDVLLVERFEDKTENLKRILNYTGNHREEAFYIFLATAFGGKVNAQAFELTAKSLPLIILAKHKNSLFQTEALLLGQSGLLEASDNSDAYILDLRKEYQFLKKKYTLKSIEPYLWKYLRIRPANFPEIRLAQFARLVHKSVHLFSKILEAENTKELMQMFSAELSGYWDTHYKIGKESKKRTKKFGKAARLSVIINTVIPTLFQYGKDKDAPDFQDKAISFLEQLPPENNRIIRLWNDAGIKPENAAETQAILQLNKHYCVPKRCLDCRIGNQLIAEH